MGHRYSINLADLTKGVSKLSPHVCAGMAEACILCLTEESHLDGVSMMVINGAASESVAVHWRDFETFEAMAWSWDHDEATEQGACALAFMLVFELTDYNVVKRTFKGKGVGFDYWLGYKDDPDPQSVLVQNKVRLEVSGLRRGKKSEITRRVEEKLSQTKQSDNLNIPAYVVVVEFSRPVSHMVMRP